MGRTVGVAVAGALEVATPGLVVATAESREQCAPLRLNRATSSARPRIRTDSNLAGVSSHMDRGIGGNVDLKTRISAAFFFLQ